MRFQVTPEDLLRTDQCSQPGKSGNLRELKNEKVRNI